ncbi:hypothetical protein KGM_206732 [Danaus plexippus plexippus]|uniref:Uncharacterized protein n=1 Tax=Danaus plexippus plexippus TaxID=278856 RepID=A0A212F2V6_DANPL|nr:hypothetical protein KGM_206732 [Danaus plexippus plexippus]
MTMKLGVGSESRYGVSNHERLSGDGLITPALHTALERRGLGSKSAELDSSDAGPSAGNTYN